MCFNNCINRKIFTLISNPVTETRQHCPRKGMHLAENFQSRTANCNSQKYYFHFKLKVKAIITVSFYVTFQEILEASFLTRIFHDGTTFYLPTIRRIG